MQEFNHVSNFVRNHLSALSCLAFIALLGACAEVGPEAGAGSGLGDEDVTGQSVPGETGETGTTDDLDNGTNETSENDEPSGPPPCAEIEAEAANLHLPVDILWAIILPGV